MKTIISKISKLSYCNNKLVNFEPCIYTFTKYNFSTQKLFNRIYPQVLNVKKSNVSPILNRKTKIKLENNNNKQQQVKSSESMNNNQQNKENINKVDEKVMKDNSNNNKSVNKKPRINRFSKRRRILRIEKLKSKSNKMLRRSFKVKSRVVEELDKSEKLKIKKNLENKMKPNEVKEEVVVEKSTFGKIKDKISNILNLNKTETEEKPKVTKEVKPIPLKEKVIHKDLKSKLNYFKESGTKKYEKIVENSKTSKKNTKLSKYRRQLVNLSKVNIIPKNEKEIKMKNLNDKIFDKSEYKYYFQEEILSIDHFNRKTFIERLQDRLKKFQDQMKINKKEEDEKYLLRLKNYQKFYEICKKINSTLDKNEIEEFKFTDKQMTEISIATGIKKSQIIRYNNHFISLYLKWYSLNTLCLKGVQYIPSNLYDMDDLIRKHMSKDKHYLEISKIFYQRRHYTNKNLRINNKIQENNEEYNRYIAKKMFKSESDYILY